MQDVVVKKVTGDRQAANLIRQMAQKGFDVQSHTTRKAAYGVLAGVFTRKQIHTITFVLRSSDAAAAGGPQAGSESGPDPERVQALRETRAAVEAYGLKGRSLMMAVAAADRHRKDGKTFDEAVEQAALEYGPKK